MVTVAWIFYAKRNGGKAKLADRQILWDCGVKIKIAYCIRMANMQMVG